jgi:hypothetical protein
MFGHFLGPRSFDNLERPLVRKQISLPTTFDGVKLISIFTIALTTYLESWAFVTSIIIVRFMVDQHPFLLETLAQDNNNTFFSQQHLKATCDLLPPPTYACLPPFKQFIGQQMV